MHTVNKRIAVSLFSTNSVNLRAEGGMPAIQQKAELTELEVLFPTDGGEYAAGDKVLLQGDAAMSPWARRPFECNGVKFILCPFEQVVAVKKAPPEPCKVPAPPAPTGYTDDTGLYHPALQR